jgi:hypothetical protein
MPFKQARPHLFFMRDKMIWYSYFAFGFGVLAAVIWFVASFVKVPRTVWLQAGVGGGRPSPELDAVLDKLRLQSRLNALAAFLTALSVLLQVLPQVLNE